MTVYKLESGEPTTSWNELLRRINALVPECEDVTPLDLLTDPALWSKTDIQDAQDKLAELCPGTTFNPIKDLWEKDKVDELIAAIAAGTCCCEEEDKTFPNLSTYQTLKLEFGSIQFASAIDWAGWIMQLVDALVIEEVDCGEGVTIESRTGGHGWVGKQFKNWEFHYGPFGIIASGTIKNGYIEVGEGAWQDIISCESTDPGAGTLFGETDPAWLFDYNISLTNPGGTPNILVTGKDMGVVADFEPGNNQNGFVNVTFPTSPYYTTSDDANHLTDVANPFLRLKCE